MITIEEKEYDLQFLLNFDMLREILIKLAQNQNILQKDVESIKNTNKERDYKLMKLEKMIKEKEKDLIDDFELIQKEDKLKEKRELESQNNNININEEEKEEQDENEELQKVEKREEEEEKSKKEEKSVKEQKKEKK